MGEFFFLLLVVDNTLLDLEKMRKKTEKTFHLPM